MKLGVNTVLFKEFTLREAFAAVALAGYDGVELSAIKGMCEHLVLDSWESQARQILDLSRQYGLELLSMEGASLEAGRLGKAFAAAEALGIPIVNVGPGGKSGVFADLAESIAALREQAERAAEHGVTLCVKAHVGASICDTPTTLQAMEAIKLPSFGIDMDPSHIYRAGESPNESFAAAWPRVKHINIRDCKGRGPGPGDPASQACGRGDIELSLFFATLADAGYDGPVCLEVIGPPQTLAQATVISAESYGFMNACMKIIGM
jgi:sugar phosphate isomerase/epimerase